MDEARTTQTGWVDFTPGTALEKLRPTRRDARSSVLGTDSKYLCTHPGTVLQVFSGHHRASCHFGNWSCLHFRPQVAAMSMVTADDSMSAFLDKSMRCRQRGGRCLGRASEGCSHRHRYMRRKVRRNALSGHESSPCPRWNA